MPGTPALWEAEANRPQVQAQPRQLKTYPVSKFKKEKKVGHVTQCKGLEFNPQYLKKRILSPGYNYD